MRTPILLAGAASFLLSATAFAQVAGTVAVPPDSPPAVSGTVVPPPATGDLPMPRPDVGLDKVAGDGVSTKVVPAVPCSTSARGTDGTTTCVGVPGPVDGSRDRYTTGSGLR